MPRPPKKAKPAGPDFVFPPGGAALAPVPGLRLKPRTGDVPRWWPNDKPGKAAFACNVVGIQWREDKLTWRVRGLGTNGKEKFLGHRSSFADACALRSDFTDGKAGRGDLVVLQGQLCVSKCAHPTCSFVNASVCNYAPDPCKFKKLFAEFDAALRVLATSQSKKALVQIEALRRAICLHCRNVKLKSRTTGENNEEAKCSSMVQEIKKTWADNGGCVECGCRDVRVLQGDHKNRSGKDQHEQMLTPSYWACHGGAQVMRQHFIGQHTTVVPTCMFCHALEKSHDIYNALPIEDFRQGSPAYRQRKYTAEKRDYVNKFKISKGTCEHPLCKDPRTNAARVITEENVHAFHCAHVDDIEKEESICKIVKKRESFSMARLKLDKELAKCKVYCGCCHHIFDTLPRMKEGREMLDALLARGAPVCEVCE